MFNSVPAHSNTARRRRIAPAAAAAVACLALSACSGPLDMPSAESSTGSGHGSGRSWAPPIEIPMPEYEPPYTNPGPNLDHGCADGASANGFACRSVPGTGGVIYPGPDPDPNPSR